MSTEQSTAGTEQETAAYATDQATDAKPSAEQKKQQILSSFKARLDRGETTMDAIAESQPWVAELLTKEGEGNSEATSIDLKESIKKELREELKSETLWESIYAKANSKEKKELEEIRDSYENTLGTAETIKLALKMTGLDTSEEGQRRRAMRLRELGGDIEDEVEVKVTASDRALSKGTMTDAKIIASRRIALEQGGSLILN